MTPPLISGAKFYTEIEKALLLAYLRRPAKFKGRLNGTEVSWDETSGFWMVLTSQIKKARRIADELGLAFFPMDGACEVLVPPSLALEILPRLGLKLNLSNRPYLKLKPGKKESPVALRPKRGLEGSCE